MAVNASTFGKKIMTGLSKGGNVAFPTPYLGLLTALPGADGSGGGELSYPGYSRVKLSVTGIKGSNILCDPFTEAGTGEDAGKTVTVIQNQEEIHFPENELGTEESQVVGFGLFESLTAQPPYLWGELKETVTVRQYSVPMFRAEDFVLRLK